MAGIIGERLRRLRYDKQWTKTRLASQAGVSLSVISLLEWGKRDEDGLTLGTLRKLARVCDMPLGAFVDGPVPDVTPQARPEHTPTF